MRTEPAVMATTICGSVPLVPPEKGYTMLAVAEIPSIFPTKSELVSMLTAFAPAAIVCDVVADVLVRARAEICGVVVTVLVTATDPPVIEPVKVPPVTFMLPPRTYTVPLAAVIPWQYPTAERRIQNKDKIIFFMSFIFTAMPECRQ